VQNRTFTRGILAAALAGALAVAAGCSGDDGDSSLEKITYLTSFGTFGRDSYVYLAQEKGYFRDAGFDVEIKAGNGSLEGIKVVAGQAQFTPIDLTGGLLAAGGQGGAAKVTGFTAVAAIQQDTMAAIMTLDGKGISLPKDLEGKTIADTPGSVVRNLFPTYAKIAGVDDKKVTFVNGSAATLFSTLSQDKADAIGQFVVGKPTIEGIEAKGKKRQAVLLPYGDALPDLYGNALITSSAYAKDNPDKVKSFTQALLKGLGESIARPEEAASALKKSVATADEASAKAELTLMKPYVMPEKSGTAIGALDAERVGRSIAILQGSGQIAAGLTPDQVVSFDLAPKA
jgi:NitT/TauT family transport system substrate-binding protein